MTSTEVTRYQNSPLKDRAAYALSLAAASDLIPRGLFDRQTGKPSPAKILLVMETGAMLGLAPMAAIAGIDVIEGRAAIAPRVALGLFRSHGHKVKIVEEGAVETGDLKVTVTLTRSDDPDEPISASFTPQQALRAGLVDSYAQDSKGVWHVKATSEKGKVLPWQTWTEDMCLWRAVSRLMRRGGQDVLMGIGYIPEELEAIVDQDGMRAIESRDDEGEVIARIKQITDKQDMRELYKELNPDGWTDRIRAEFDAHLMTLTVDSNPKPNTGQLESGIVPADEGEAEAMLDAAEEMTADPASGEVPLEELAHTVAAQRAAKVNPDELEGDDLEAYLAAVADAERAGEEA